MVGQETTGKREQGSGNRRAIPYSRFPFPCRFSARDRIRTCDLQLRRLTLYPAELRARTRAIAANLTAKNTWLNKSPGQLAFGYAPARAQSTHSDASIVCRAACAEPERRRSRRSAGEPELLAATNHPCRTSFGWLQRHTIGLNDLHPFRLLQCRRKKPAVSHGYPDLVSRGVSLCATERVDLRVHDLDLRQRLGHVEVEHRLIARPPLHHLRRSVLAVELRVVPADLDGAELWMREPRPRFEAGSAKFLVAVPQHFDRFNGPVAIVVALTSAIPQRVAVPDRADEKVAEIW